METKISYIKKAAELFSQIQKAKPLVHCITNGVTVNDCANILLAAGARPTMAHHTKEAAEVTAGCDALVCNFGATDDYEAMLLAAKEADGLAHPIILDPVGAGGSSFRRKKIREFFDKVHVSCIRGNASEMLAVFRDAGTVVGVDARESDEKDVEGLIIQASEFAREHGCVCVISGRTDIITDGNKEVLIKNGSPLMSKITGSGCMSTALLGAFFALEKSVAAGAAVPVVMGIAGELAGKECKKEHSGTMSFKMHMIDRISLLEENDIIKYGKLEINKD